MTAVTDIYMGAAAISHTMDDIGDTPAADVKKVVIQRQPASGGDWVTVREIPVVTSDDIVFVLYDYTALSMAAYSYRSVIVLADSETPGGTASLTVRTRGISIAENDRAYIALFNTSYTHQRNFPFAQVVPYYSRYPHIVQNGTMNYESGSAEGFFNPIGDGCQIAMKYGDYERELVDFLSDGIPKMLTTQDGRGWYVEISSPVTHHADGVNGVVSAQFDWVEVGAPPGGVTVLGKG